MAINQIQMGVNFRKNINSKSAADHARTGRSPEGAQLHGGSRRDSGSAGEAVGVHTRAGGTGRGREAGRTGHLLSDHPQQEGWRD